MPNQFAVPTPSDKPSLADANVVFSLIGSFEAEVLRISAAFHGGRPGFEDAKDRILAECKRYGDIFSGADAAYEPSPWIRMNVAWMRHMVMASHDKEAKALTDLPMEQSDPGKAYFLLLAKLVMSISRDSAGGASDADAQARLADVNRRFAGVFLGAN